jgi:predicted PurR-regulated permease PerM
MMNSEVSLGRFLKIILILITLAITFFIVDSLSNVLLPFFVAWLIAYLLYPMVKFFQYRLRFKYRMLSIIATMVVALAVVIGVVMLILPSMVSEFASFKSVAISFFGEQIKNPTIPPVIAEQIQDFGKEQGIMQLLQSDGFNDLLSDAWQRTQSMLLGTINLVAQFAASFIVLLYIFFILLDYERLADEWKEVLPVKWRNFATKLSDDLTDGMSQYFRGQALVALCVGILYATGLRIIDFPAAIAFGLFIGVLNLVPYLQLVSVAPMVLLAVLKAASTGDDFWIIIMSACAVLLVVQLIQDMLLVPYIMGKRMNLHPAVILLSLSIWGKLLGLLGMIVALPLTTILLAYLKRYHEIAEFSKSDEEQILKKAINSANVASDKEKQ